MAESRQSTPAWVDRVATQAPSAYGLLDQITHEVVTYTSFA